MPLNCIVLGLTCFWFGFGRGEIATAQILGIHRAAMARFRRAPRGRIGEGRLAAVAPQTPWLGGQPENCSGEFLTHGGTGFIVKKTALAMLFALALLPAAVMAQVEIRVAPPPPIVETRPPAPERGMVWIDGYHRWDGNRYVWTPGRWDRPPHPGAHWVAHRWRHEHGHWVLVEGHWR